jgi:hypothetical protein
MARQPDIGSSDSTAEKTDVQKSRDFWDKAQVVGTIVVAIASLIANSWITKRTQDITERVEQQKQELAKATADAQARTETAKMLAALIEPLTSDNPQKQILAIGGSLALVKQSDKTIEGVLIDIGQNTKSPAVLQKVREVLRQTPGSLEVSSFLSQTAQLPSPADAPQLQPGFRIVDPYLYNDAQRVSIRSSITSQVSGTAIFYAAAEGNEAFEDDKVQGGVFTNFLLDGLNKPDIVTDGSLWLDSLFTYLSREMARHNAAQGRPTYSPILENSGDRNAPPFSACR